jgi:hypothetical protein
MQAYIGTKVVLAEPMSDVQFRATVKGEAHDGLTEARPGYLVVYPNPEGDYKSWSPIEVFEQAYRPVSDAEKGLINRSKTGFIRAKHAVGEDI